jgi:hypothetical protein
MKDDDKKVQSAIWQLISNFFIAHLPILIRRKTKGPVSAVWALLRNWELGAYLPISVHDWPIGVVTLKGLEIGGFGFLNSIVEESREYAWSLNNMGYTYRDWVTR